jgi:photosystem II stability/assembly factor-like uncharacterized protein
MSHGVTRSALFLAACFALAAPTPRFDSWRVIGPGGGGALFVPVVSPHDPRTVLVACDMTGSYITHGAGASWRMFNLRERVRFFAFDPTDRHVIYAQAGDLFRSIDEGGTWRLVLPRPETIRRVRLGDDHAEASLEISAEPRGEIAAVAVDPGDSQSLYIGVNAGVGAGVNANRQAALWRSFDGGVTWHKSAELPGGARHIWIDSHSPKADRTLYVAGSQAVAIRQDGHWLTGDSLGEPRGQSPRDSSRESQAAFTDISAGWPQAGPPVFYAVSGGKVFVSEGGVKWRESPLPGFQGKARAVATSLNHPDVAYVSYSGLRAPLSGSFGVAKTSDRGRHWDLVWQTWRGGGQNVRDPWIVNRFGAGWPGNPRALAVAPTDPNICYGTDDGRAVRTTDGGKTWDGVYSNAAPDGGFTTNGLDVTTCYGVHFDPFDPKRLFISYTDIGVFASDNGGASWHSATRNGVPGAWVNTTYWMEFDPQVRGRVWAAMSAVHDLPRPKMWRSRSPDTYDGGVVRSDDGGVTWRVSGQGMPPTAATHILLDPASPQGARVLYAAGFGRGVFKSTDGGEHWELRNAGIEGAQPFAWRLARDGQGALYLVVARRSDDGSFGGTLPNPIGGDGALYRSTDGAAHWTRIELPKGVNGPNGIAVDAADPRRLYLAAWARSTREGAVDGGIFLSTDAGATWRNVLSQDQHIYDITGDARQPGVLYAAGFESSAWRSADRGVSWKRIRGFNFKWGHRVIPDPADPASIYITTFGGSVWHGPAAGDPKAVEDIVDAPLAPAPR